MRIFWTNLIDAAGVDLLASSEQLEFPATNVMNQQRTEPWKSTDAAASPFLESLRFDLLTAQLATALLILDHNISSSDTNNKLQAHTADAWGSPAFSTNLTHAAGVISALFIQTFRYWRWQTNKVNGTAKREIGRIFIGPYYTTTIQPDYDGYRRILADNDVAVASAGGQVYAMSRPKPRQFTIDISGIPKVDRDQFLLLYAAVGTHTAFILQIDPSAAAGDELSEFLHVRFSKDPAMDAEGFDADLVWATRWDLLEAI